MKTEGSFRYGVLINSFGTLLPSSRRKRSQPWRSMRRAIPVMSVAITPGQCQRRKGRDSGPTSENPEDIAPEQAHFTDAMMGEEC